MSEGLLIEIMQLLIQTVALISAPIIVTVLVVGILSQVLQTVTQMKDMSLTFVPKVFASGIVFTLAIPWYIQLAQRFTEIIFQMVANAGNGM